MTDTRKWSAPTNAPHPPRGLCTEADDKAPWTDPQPNDRNPCLGCPALAACREYAQGVPWSGPLWIAGWRAPKYGHGRGEGNFVPWRGTPEFPLTIQLSFHDWKILRRHLLNGATVAQATKQLERNWRYYPKRRAQDAARTRVEASQSHGTPAGDPECQPAVQDAL